MHVYREKMDQQPSVEDSKHAKQEQQMQDKIEREQKKQEQKKNKKEEKERKKRGKEEAKRASLGLDNVMHLHELDLSNKNGRAQAQFIDASTAALF